ncbi:MAG: hypothetical protein KTR28_07320 [Micavibrio sp.]|nr:hypothetical protein [Micavibrio sp.]
MSMKFGTFLNNTNSYKDSEYGESKRRYSRRENDRCVAVINNQPHPIYNWSVGGVLVNADDRLYAVDESVPVTMKFKIGSEVKAVEQTARVIRRAAGKVALQFVPRDTSTNGQMQHILNDCITDQFVESQLA